MRYTPEEQIDAILRDLRADIAHAENQAEYGPLFPELGITADSLRAYAQRCREQIARVETSASTPLSTVNAYIAGSI